MGNLRSREQELPTRLSTDAHPHRLLLLQERHTTYRQLTHRIRLASPMVKLVQYNQH